MSEEEAKKDAEAACPTECALLCADQMLALLVMDFGYIGEPLYGHSPMRHQMAWKRCADILGKDVMDEKIKEMNEQAIKERPSLDEQIVTLYSAEEMNHDVVVSKVGDT